MVIQGGSQITAVLGSGFKCAPLIPHSSLYHHHWFEIQNLLLLQKYKNENNLM